MLTRCVHRALRTCTVQPVRTAARRPFLTRQTDRLVGGVRELRKPKNTADVFRSIIRACQSTSSSSYGHPSEKQAAFNLVTYVPVYPIGQEAVVTEVDGETIFVKWRSSLQSRYHSIWLRHNCHCELCKQPQSGQKLVNLLVLPETLTISSAWVKDDFVEIRWKEEPDHRGVLPLKFLQDNCYSSTTLENRDKTLRPEPYSQDGIPSVTYEEIRSNEGLLKLMSNISHYGICQVENVGVEEGGGVKLAEMIAPVQHTIYGRSFAVVSVPDPINIAYSSTKLDLHIDLAYYESPPGLQVFHCQRFDECVAGGESIFLDVIPVAEEFRRSNPDEFQTLTRIPATFQKIHFNRERPVFMTYQRPHIVLNHRNEITGVFWSPAFEAPLSVREEDVELYYRAYRQFAKAIRDSPLKKVTRLRPGIAVIFNNRRILHGREEFFLNGGTRRFEGCYVNIDEFKSHFRYLSHAMGRDAMPIRVGNQCYF